MPPEITPYLVGIRGVQNLRSGRVALADGIQAFRAN